MMSLLVTFFALVSAAPYEEGKLGSFLNMKPGSVSFAAVRDEELANIKTSNPQGMGSMSDADWVLVKNGVERNLARSGDRASHMMAVPDHLPHHSDRYFNNDEWAASDPRYQRENAMDMQDKTWSEDRKAQYFLNH